MDAGERGLIVGAMLLSRFGDSIQYIIGELILENL